MNGENRHQIEVSKLLHEFGKKGLKAPDNFMEDAIKLAQNVFRKLQMHSKKFTVAAPRFAGSFGKQTDVIQPDLDLVVVVNNCEPPYDQVLDQFEDILLLNETELKIRPGSIEKKTSFSLQFVFVNGIEVDLLPAANLKPDQIYRIIAENPEKYYSYSSCLVEKQIAFMKSHSSSFLHCLVRLVKYWFKSLLFKDKKVYGGSTIMELVGVAAAEDEEAKFDNPNIVRAFIRVMDWICKLDTLKLAFAEQIGNTWIRVNSNYLNLKNSIEVVPSIVGTADILTRKYFIIEPANPFNDLLGDKDPLVIERLMKFAMVTRQRMSNLMDGHYATFNHSTKVVEVDIMKLFEPQPSNWVIEYPLGVTQDFFIQCANRYSSRHYDMKVRNEDIFKKSDVKNFVETMKWNLIATVNSATNGNPTKNATTKDVRNSVERLIETSLDTKLVTATANHEDYHITLTIPYTIDDVIYAIKCSLRWK